MLSLKLVEAWNKITSKMGPRSESQCWYCQSSEENEAEDRESEGCSREVMVVLIESPILEKSTW